MQSYNAPAIGVTRKVNTPKRRKMLLAPAFIGLGAQNVCESQIIETIVNHRESTPKQNSRHAISHHHRIQLPARSLSQNSNSIFNLHAAASQQQHNAHSHHHHGHHHHNGSHLHLHNNRQITPGTSSHSESTPGTATAIHYPAHLSSNKSSAENTPLPASIAHMHQQNFFNVFSPINSSREHYNNSQQQPLLQHNTRPSPSPIPHPHSHSQQQQQQQQFFQSNSSSQQQQQQQQRTTTLKFNQPTPNKSAANSNNKKINVSSNPSIAKNPSLWTAVALQQELAKKFMGPEQPHPRVLFPKKNKNGHNAPVHEHLQTEDFDMIYKPKLSLAQKLGLVKAPDAPLSDSEWKQIEERAKMRNAFADPCPICFEPLGKNDHLLLNCTHVFHKACLRSFERFIGVHEKRCPICRKEEYQKRNTTEGKVLYMNQAATKYVTR